MSKLQMFQPMQIGRMKIKNRIVFPPMNTNLTSEEGYVTPELEEYYVRRAEGGVGMVVLEAATIDANSRNHPGQPVLFDRKHVAGWAHLTERLHRYDVRVSVELVHYGSEASIPPRESPSATSKYTDDPGEVLSIDRIHEIQRQFAYSAKLAKQCGMEQMLTGIYDRTFTDAADVPSYARAAVYWAVYQEIWCGTDSLAAGTTLAPKAPATRAQIAVMITRYLEKFPTK